MRVEKRFLIPASRLATAVKFLSALLCAVPGLQAQSLMQSRIPGGHVNVYNSDLAVLEAQMERDDLPCSVNPVKPFLGFDLRFHAGYEVVVPLKDIAGSEDLLTMVMRVTPLQNGGDVAYFSQRIFVPKMSEDMKGNAYLQGVFDLGEGKYKIDWLMRDRSERVCSSYWDAEAELPSKDRDLALMIGANTVEEAEREPFREEPPVDRKDGETFNVKVLVNFAPQKAHASTLQPLDVNALVSILRSIAREPRITKFSLIAFNMQEQRVIYRQETSGHIDFPALGDALESIKLGVVDLKKLSEKNSDTKFLTDLITSELTTEDEPDALIFAGPKVMLDEKVPESSLKEVGSLDYPVYYMNYNFNPRMNPWRDAIGNAVKFFRGQEFTISRPRDLWFAWTEIMSNIVKLKGKRTTAANATSSTQ